MSAPGVKNAIRFSIRLIEKNTCLRFYESYHGQRIIFVEGRGYVIICISTQICYVHLSQCLLRCSSPIGRPSDDRSPRIRLSRFCRRAIPAHEIFHSLGRFHEQARPDRDKYVRIFLKNVRNPSKADSTVIISVKENIIIIIIATGYSHNFYKQRNADTQGVPYDFDSVMHYSATAFAKPGTKTIVPRDPNIDLASLGQRSHLSTWDMLQINIRYCPGCLHVQLLH